MGLAQRFIENGDKLVNINQANTYSEGAQDFTGAASVSVPAPSSSAHAATKTYVDTEIANAVVLNRPWREVLLDASQLISGSPGGIASAAAFICETPPNSTETFNLKNSTGTETYTFVSGTPADETEVQVGGAAVSLASLAAAIEARTSGMWHAYVRTSLSSIAGAVLVIVERLVDGTSRAYGTSLAAFKCASFTGGKYEAATTGYMGSTDPGAGQGTFGFARAEASLIPNETHQCRASDATATWDSDGSAWSTWDTAAYTAGDGLSLSGNQFAVSLADSNPGLQFSSSKLAVKVNGSAGLGVDSDGVKIVLKPVSGLEFDSGIGVKANTDKGVDLDSDGVKVKVANSAGSAFDGSGNLRVAVDKETRATQSGATSGDAAATSLVIDFDNDGGGVPEIFVGLASGFKVANGTGDQATADCYFSADSGTTARAWSAIVSGDTLYWNGNVATSGGNLANGDKLRVKSASLG